MRSLKGALDMKKLSGVYGGSYTSEIDVNAELLYGWRQGLRFN